MSLAAVPIVAAPSNGRPTFHIAFCADDNYCRPMGATIASIVANNPGQHFTFHLLAIALSDDNQARFKRLDAMLPAAATRIHLLDEALFAQFSGFLGHSHYSLSIFTRLVIPDVLQGQTERVLYLDADILCLGKLDELIDIDFDGKLAVVVPDAPVTTRRRVAALDLPHEEYFNAGVMLINVAPWIAAGALFGGYLAQSPWADLALDGAPRNTKEMRMHSRFLLRQGKPLQSLGWYVRYLRKRRRK